jgi:hypothetical protein
MRRRRKMLSARRNSQSRRETLVAALTVLIGLSAGAGSAAAQQDGRQAIRQACDADYRSLCAGVQPGGGRIVACLQQNSAKLSPQCREALQSAKASRPRS